MIWAAESRGILSVDQTNGNVISEIPLTPDAEALAVDLQHKALWTFTGQTLSSFDFAGSPRSTTPISNPPVGNPQILTVDTQANRVWLAVQTQLYLFDTGGNLLSQTRLPNPIAGITLDRTKSRLWVASKGSLTTFDSQGNQFGQINTSDIKFIHALDYDFRLNQVWVAADDTLRRYTPDGTLTFSKQNSFFSGLAFIAADQDSGIWATDARQLAHLDSTGTIGFTLAPYAGTTQPNFIVSLIADFVSHSAWIASQRNITHYAVDSTLLGNFQPSVADGKSRLIRQLALPALPPPPKVQIVSPATNSYLNTPYPTFSLTYQGDFIDLNSIRFTADGTPLPVSCTAQPTSASCTTAQTLADGTYDIVVTMANTVGAISQPVLVHVIIDTIPPTITLTNPANGFLTNQRNLQITGNLSETSTLTINGNPVPVQNLQFSAPMTLVEGTNSFQLRATDLAGNVGTAAFSGTLDTTPPPVPTANLIRTTAANGQVTVNGLAGSVEGNSRVTVVNTSTGDRVTVTANPDGSFSAILPGGNGDSLQIFATDAAGNQGTATTIIATGGPFSGAIRFGTISPANGTTVDGDLVLIAVDLQAPPNTGVTINGVIAEPVFGPSGLRYYANVPLLPGQNTIAVAAYSQDGRTQNRAVTINSTGPFPYRIIPDRASGASPLTTKFTVLDQLGLGIRQIQVDFHNNGTVDFTTNDPGAAISAGYTGVGIQQTRFIVFDNGGVGHVQTVPVLLIDPAVADQSIQAIWGAMNAALAAGDKLSAVQYMTPDEQNRFGPIVDALRSRMPQIVASYSALRKSQVTGSYAEYGLNRTINGANHVFLIDFVTNQLGQWQLDSM